MHRGQNKATSIIQTRTSQQVNLGTQLCREYLEVRHENVWIYGTFKKCIVWCDFLEYWAA
jgi:hypothetical protein